MKPPPTCCGEEMCRGTGYFFCRKCHATAQHDHSDDNVETLVCTCCVTFTKPSINLEIFKKQVRKVPILECSNCHDLFGIGRQYYTCALCHKSLDNIFYCCYFDESSVHFCSEEHAKSYIEKYYPIKKSEFLHPQRKNA